MEACCFSWRASVCRYAHTALSALDGLSVAHPVNARTLAACVLPYGAGRRVPLARVLVSTLAFSRNDRLAASKATHLCLSSTLHVLMNLTHECDAGCEAVVASGGLEAVAGVLVRYCCQTTGSCQAASTALRVLGGLSCAGSESALGGGLHAQGALPQVLLSGLFWTSTKQCARSESCR